MSRLKRAGAKVSHQTFQKVEPVSGARFQLTNIVGRLMPERPQRVLLGSHWDTRLWAEEDSDASRREAPIAGANDGSSGLAVLLEVARQVDQLSLGHLGVDIVFFDGEEFGRPGSNDYCAGSRHFAEHLKAYYPEAPPIAVIVIDMVGDQDLAFPPEQSSVVNARALTTLIWREGVRLRAPAFLRGLGLENPSQPKPAPQGKWIIDDHTPFQKLKIPATLIIDLEYPQWHTHQDTLDRVSPQSLLQTGEVLIASLKRLDQLSASQPSRSSTPSP
jgi:Zn-dependent M28 family amino/carboxypeptidase